MQRWPKGTLWFFHYDKHNPTSRFPTCCSFCLEMSYSRYYGPFSLPQHIQVSVQMFASQETFDLFISIFNDALFFLIVFINTKYYSVCLFSYSLPLLLELCEVSKLSLPYFSDLDQCLAHSKWAKCIYLLNKWRNNPWRKWEYWYNWTGRKWEWVMLVIYYW